jgi:alkylhydroperoxidase family enzyme
LHKNEEAILAARAQPRIPPGGFWQIGPIAWIANKAGARLMGVPDYRVVTTLGRNKRLFPFFFAYVSYFQYLSHIRLRNVELAILRVAHLRRSVYELNHHIVMSARAGITDEERARVGEGPSAPGWTAKEKALLTAVDGYIKDKAVPDADWAELRKHFHERQILEILLLVGAYDSLATAFDIIGLQTEYPTNPFG